MATSVKVKLNNPALLRWAREAAGYSAEDMAQALHRPTEQVLAWETGEAQPTYRQLQAYAAKVKRSVSTLFLPEPPDEPGPLPDYRLRPGTAAGDYPPATRLAVRMLRNSLQDLRDLLDEMTEPIHLDLPQWPDASDPEQMATTMRELLGVTVEEQTTWRDTRRALDEWRDALFGHGAICQVLKLPVAEARGISLIECGLGGIGLSSQDADAARPFSLFHEVAHLCLRRPGVSGDTSDEVDEGSEEGAQVERFCDRFAGAFLLPAGDALVRNALDDLAACFSRDRAERYARTFGVSKYVFARRATELGLVPPSAYWSAHMAWEAQDAARSRPMGQPDYVRVTVSHTGKRYVATVLEALDRGIVTRHTASRLLALQSAALDRARGMVAPI